MQHYSNPRQGPNATVSFGGLLCWSLIVAFGACAGRTPTERVATSHVTVVPRLGDFLSSHNNAVAVVKIEVVPDRVHIEEKRSSMELDFDFVVTGLSDRNLVLRFVKVAAYDAGGRLLTYRFVNHNGMNPSIRSLGKWTIEGREAMDIYNPFHSFPKGLPVASLRYMFTFADKKSKEEFYHGDLVVRPARYVQQARLHLPMRGLLTVLDGHDYYSHHRRFSTLTLDKATSGQVVRNFSRHAIDLVPVGPNGHLRNVPPAQLKRSYDFHVPDARVFHGHGAEVFSPGDGTVVDVVNSLPDLYKKPFDLKAAIRDHRLKDMAGNLVVIKHNASEYSHLFHLLRGSITLRKGQRVKRGQLVGKLGFSGAATTYVHLHYQLMDGPDPLRSKALPVVFDDVAVIEGAQAKRYDRVMVDTGDLIQADSRSPKK